MVINKEWSCFHGDVNICNSRCFYDYNILWILKRQWHTDKAHLGQPSEFICHGITERLRLEGTPGSALVQPSCSRRGISRQVPSSISRWLLSISRSLQTCIQEVQAQTAHRFSILFLYCYLQFDHDNKAALMETIKDIQVVCPLTDSIIQKLRNLKQPLAGFDSR